MLLKQGQEGQLPDYLQAVGPQKEIKKFQNTVQKKNVEYFWWKIHFDETKPLIKNDV